MLAKKIITGAVNLVKNEALEIKGCTKGLRTQLSTNYKVGKRLAQRDGYSTIPTVATSIFTRTKMSSKDVPAACALVGAFSPVPLGSVFGYYLGKAAVKIPVKSVFSKFAC